MIINIKLLAISVYKREYERNGWEKSVHLCNSLIDNTSERWTKLKKCKWTHVKQFKLICHFWMFYHDIKCVFCLKFEEIFGLVCLDLGTGVKPETRKFTLWTDLTEGLCKWH